MTSANATLKRLFPYTRAQAMRLWWNLVSLWHIKRSMKAADLLEQAADKVTRWQHLAEQAAKRADEWDVEVRRMRGQQ
jgi:hypothetical protein